MVTVFNGTYLNFIQSLRDNPDCFEDTVNLPENNPGAGVMVSEKIKAKPFLLNGVIQIAPRKIKAYFIPLEHGTYHLSFGSNMPHTFVGGEKGMAAQSIHI